MEASSTTCGLCRNNRPLQESHLLPKAAYRHLRDRALANPHPVAITRKTVLFTPDQVRTPLLCSECEQLFSRKGENFVLRQCAQHAGQFRLREQLEATTPLLRTPDFTAYDAAAVLGETIDFYLYFAASVFWRAAAIRWDMGSNQTFQLSLGEKYREQFRIYLLGQAPFPPNGRVSLHVASEPSAQLLDIAFPSSVPSRNRRGVLYAHRHKFYMLGLIFTLFLGQKTPQRYDNGPLNGTQPCILLRPWRKDSLFEAGIEMAMGATRVGVLRRSAERP